MNTFTDIKDGAALIDGMNRKAPVAPESMTNKWYRLSGDMANAQANEQLGQINTKGNAQLNAGLSGLGFRGNNNYGSMERLAGAGVGSAASSGQAAGLSRYNNLAKMYGEGLSKIEIPTLIGQDQAAAQKNAQNDSNFIGNFFSNLFG